MPERRPRGSGLLSGPLFLVACLLGCVLLLVVPGPSWALASSLAVTPATPFCVVGETARLHVTGTMAAPVEAVTARVQVCGPGRPSSGPEDWPITAELTVPMGDLEGEVDYTISLPARALPQAGAFEARVTVGAGDTQLGLMSTWLAAVVSDQANVDLALVLPLIRGVRQDPSGAFVDSVIRETAAPFSDAGGSLYLPASLLRDFPGWHFSLAVEPALLSQLESQTGGFSEVSGGSLTEYSAESTEARQAAGGLAVLRGLAREPAVEIIPTPYAAPAAAVLAEQGWQEGLEQMRLGRATLQRVLQPGQISGGAYVPGQDLTTRCLAYFSQASVEYVVASAMVTKDLAESSQDPLLPVRIADSENNRVTLMPVSSELSSALADTWDVPRFFAAVASLLADGRSVLIAAPAHDYAQLDPAGLRALGLGLSQTEFISTLTLAELLEKHPPSSRPVFLSRFGGHQPGLMAHTLIERIREARGPIADLVVAAGERAGPVSAARVALFHAESRLWLREGADPAHVNLGLSWAREARRVVEGEFAAVHVGKVNAREREGRAVDVAVAVDNAAGQPMSLAFEVAPSEGGEPLTVVERTVEVGGGTVVLEGIAVPTGRYLLAVRAGSTELASVPFSVRWGWAAEWWLWTAAALVLCTAAVVTAKWWRRRTASPPPKGEPAVRRVRRGPS